MLDVIPSDPPQRGGFDITWAIRGTCRELVRYLPPLRHIEVERIAFSFAQTRNASRYGLYATITPLRFEGGRRVATLNRTRYAVQRVVDARGREMLYILTVYLPRFMNTGLVEKLATLVHELWHISPEFNGDLRRFPGRCYVHSRSQREYDQQMDALARHWLQLGPPYDSYAFLDLSFRELLRRHGRIVGTRVPHPKLVKLGPAR